MITGTGRTVPHYKHLAAITLESGFPHPFLFALPGRELNKDLPPDRDYPALVVSPPMGVFYFWKMWYMKKEEVRWKGEGILLNLGKNLKPQLSKPSGKRLTLWLDLIRINSGKMLAGPGWLNLPLEKIANSVGKLIIFYPFPKEEKMILIIFNRFIGKTMKAKLMIIPIGFAL
jgi:hypothetical protein